ncbi:MAG: hypothetical protein KA586_04615 [Candidatus Promineofilum sp.]|nr:hypothetical protein [Promineifilum sp.]
MSFNWLNDFHQDMAKRPDYAEKTLAAYRLGMKAKGSIRGVRIEVDGEGCLASQSLDPDAEYLPDDAPLLPLPECSKGMSCRCVYRPVMTYEPREE